ncbi:MAG: 23S rRNA (uridine2552-2'-O)-methyltransferase [Pelagibacterales bacterium]|jgi:23S rRNA (uridine2552-2'-O)-methyltransferase|nr:23S rRNA (uridine2552-2'-O)-methyltransferase [Pelagibacterales bacterium]
MKKTKRSKKSRSWVIKQHRDQFFKKSKVLGFRSRAAFKLIELNEKFNFIKKNTKILDVGSSPGGWSQVSSKIITNGKILAIDKKPMESIKNVNFLNEDFLNVSVKNKIFEEFKGKIDVVISDMAADTTGNKSVDCIRTNNLCSEVINFSLNILKNKGSLIAKLFMGEDFIEVKNLAKKCFKKVEFYKPKSSKKESKETYIICSTLNTL